MLQVSKLAITYISIDIYLLKYCNIKNVYIKNALIIIKFIKDKQNMIYEHC